MEGNLGSQPGTLHHSIPLGTAFYRAGSGLTRGGLGAYGERFLGSSSEFMQSNVTSVILWLYLAVILFCIQIYPKSYLYCSCEQVSQWLSDPQYYFQVNGQYVRNKLKMILFLFLHRVSIHSLSSYNDTLFRNSVLFYCLKSGTLDKDN